MMIFKLIKYSLVDRLIQGAKLQNNREICKFNPILFFIVALSLVVRTAERISSVICKYDSATTAKLFIVDFYENNC